MGGLLINKADEFWEYPKKRRKIKLTSRVSEQKKKNLKLDVAVLFRRNKVCFGNEKHSASPLFTLRVKRRGYSRPSVSDRRNQRCKYRHATKRR